MPAPPPLTVRHSGRDNIETNVPWTYWPEGHPQGLGPDFILPYLARGMMRPGMINLLVWLREIGATVVVYTHSEERWATKVGLLPQTRV